MKHFISTTLLLITFLGSNLNAQQISSANYNKEFIHENFNQEGEHFKIVTTTDNYFILDKGDYLLSRNNNESEYAIIANKSSANNFILKTAVRLEPSNNKKASIGIVLKAQQDGKGAIIFEINKKREYRIKKLLGNTYKTLSGSSKQKGWVKNKTISGVDEHNFIEIRSENNIYDIYVNSDYLNTFFIPDYTNGSCGLIISPETKARVAYYYINTKGGKEQSVATYTNENTTNVNTTIEDLNKEIETLKKNNATLNNLNTEARGNQDEAISNLTQKNTEFASVTIEKEKEITSLQKIITDLKSNNEKIGGLEAIITKNTTLIINLTEEKSALSTEVTKLTETTTRLNTKNTELAAVTIEQEKEIVSLQSAIKDLKSKNTSTNSTNKQQTKKINDLKQQVTIEKSVSTNLTNDLNKVNKSSNSKIKKLTTEVNILKIQLNTTTNINTSLTSDLAAEKITHSKTKNGLSNSVKNKAAELKNAKQEISVLEKINNKHNDIVNDLNSQLTLLKAIQLELNTEVQTLNKKISNLETNNVELKELFILKDFEVNGVKPSELTKQTNTYPTPKEIKGTSTIYAVQFGVFMQMQVYSTLKALDDVWYETTEQGTYVYFSGEFKNPQKATVHKNKVAALGYPNAFVVTLTK